MNSGYEAAAAGRTPCDVKVFSNEALFPTAHIARARSDLPRAPVLPLSAVILLNSPAVGPWELKEYRRLFQAYRGQGDATAGVRSPRDDALPCYFVCADGAYSTLRRHWAECGSPEHQELLPDVVIGDMDSCDPSALPTAAAGGDGGASTGPVLHRYDAVTDIPDGVLASIRARALSGTTSAPPFYIRIACQMTNDYQKAVGLLQRLEDAFPLDFPRLRRDGTCSTFVLCCDPCVRAEAMSERYTAAKEAVLGSLATKSAGAWGEFASAADREAERGRIASLLEEVTACGDGAKRGLSRSHMLPSVAVMGALGGRFDHEMGSMNCVLQHSRTYHMMVTNAENIITACWPDGVTQWLTYNEEGEGAGKKQRERCGGCGILPMGTVREMETTGLLYNIVKGRPSRCDAVTQTSGYRFSFDGLLSSCNCVSDRIVTVDVRPLHQPAQRDTEEGSVNPPTLLSCSRTP